MLGIFKKNLKKSIKEEWDFDFLKKFDFSIIINIGARYEEKNDIDKNLIKQFPKSFFLLIEPNRDCDKEIHNVYGKKNLNYKLFSYCLSSTKKNINLYVRGGKTSIFKSKAMKEKKINYHRIDKIKTYTFDEKFHKYISENKDKKILMKIDTEGSELEIIKGAKKSLKYIDAIIFEINNIDRFEGGCNSFSINKFISKYEFFASKTIISNIVKGKENKKIINYQDILYLKKNKIW